MLASAPDTSLALDGCRIDRTLGNAVEIVEAEPRNRRFPDRITESLGICLKQGGEHDVRVFGRVLRYPTNSICVRPPGCVWATDATGPASFLSLDIEPILLPEGGFTGSMQFRAAESLPNLVPAVRRLRSTASVLAKESIVTDLINRLIDGHVLTAPELGPAPARGAVARARELLTSRLAQPPSLQELARELDSNRFVLLREFRKALGVPPHAFVLRVRIERSRQLLARGYHATEVAHELGFADQSHFTRYFKRLVGLSPGAYQRHVRSVG